MLAFTVGFWDLGFDFAVWGGDGAEGRLVRLVGNGGWLAVGRAVVGWLMVMINGCEGRRSIGGALISAVESGNVTRYGAEVSHVYVGVGWDGSFGPVSA